MSKHGNEKALVVSEQEIAHLDEMLKNIDSDISVAMSHVRRMQGLTFKDLEARFLGLNGNTLRSYMQQSYKLMRPVHFVAAYSWITMVPGTSFYHSLKMKESFRGMDSSAINALFHIDKLSLSKFNVIIDIILNLFEENSREEFILFKQILENEYDLASTYDIYTPPDTIDMELFAKDYYRSLAIKAKKYRLDNNISMDMAARILGISNYQYAVLENKHKTTPFSFSIGIRARLGFKMKKHDDFSSEMVHYPDFHKFRCFQNFRDILIVEALRRLNIKQKQYVVNIMSKLSLNA
jgi:hypothetical protein